MDKIKVNNQVVSMRKFVKQGKTHAVNKCTKQIKFLQNRKGNEEQMAKTKRKLQRLLEEVKILKKIKPDSVSKLALSKAKDWNSVLVQKNIPLEERCFAMLANHPPVQKSVEKFLNDYSELIPKIPELVKEWEGKKEKRSLFKKQKGKPNNANNPNTLPLGNKNSLGKCSEVQTKCQNFNSLEILPDHSNVQNIQNDVSNRNLKMKKCAKRILSSDNTSDKLVSESILSIPIGKKPLAFSNAKKDISDDNASDNLVSTSILSTFNEKSLASNDAESYESNDSLSDNSDFANHLSSQSEENVSVNGKTKDSQSFKNSKPSKACAISPQSKLSEKISLHKKELVHNSDNNKAKVESNKYENSEKLQNIRSKLLDFSTSKTKRQNEPKNKSLMVFQRPNSNADSDDELEKVDKNFNIDRAKTKHLVPKKAELKNKIKAVTMLDLNALQDVNEIPIDKSSSEDEDETFVESGKQKKDPFFLHNGEPVSESDEDGELETQIARKREFPSFKKEPYDNFIKRDQRDNSFQKRKFNQNSVNERRSKFRENSFVKNTKESYFKDNKQNFKLAFYGNSDKRQNKSVKFASKDKFSNRNCLNIFGKNFEEKTISQNSNRDSKWNRHSSKPDSSNFVPKNKPDDKPLHPSWEAKRKLKEAAKLKFQGKRMVFKD